MAALTLSEGVEQWEGIEDATARRRIQNKLAQRRYRRNHRPSSVSRLTTVHCSKQQGHLAQGQNPFHTESQPRLEIITVASPTRTARQAQGTPSPGSSQARIESGIRTPPSSIPTFTESHDLELSTIDQRQHHLNSSKTDFLADINPDESALPEFENEFFIDDIDFEETPQLDTVAQLGLDDPAHREPLCSAFQDHHLTQHTSSDSCNVEDHSGTGGRQSTLVAKRQSVTKAVPQVLPARTTPLHCAVLGDHIDIVRLLIAFGSSLDCTDALGRTALHIAVENDHDKLVKVLLNSKADWTGRNAKGETLLHTAAQTGHLASMRALLEVVTEVNSVDHLGRTALHIAASMGNQEMVSLMIRKGANLNVGVQAGTHG